MPAFAGMTSDVQRRGESLQLCSIAALLVAESDPKNKDVLIRLVMNMLAQSE